MGRLLRACAVGLFAGSASLGVIAQPVVAAIAGSGTSSQSVGLAVRHAAFASLASSGLVVPDSAFAIPANAIYVDQSRGADNYPGTAAQPLATVSRAVSRASNGATIVIRTGVYRETLGAISKRITLQAYPHEQVWLSGSDVVGVWVPHTKNVWVHTNWTTQFCQTCFDPRAIDAAAPNAGRPDMVFLNGRPLRQVTAIAAVVQGTFFADYATHNLYVGDDPFAPGTLIEAAASARAAQFSAMASGSAVLGIGFQHYASYWDTANNPAMVVVAGASNMVFDRDVFAFGASRGLAIYARSNTVTNSWFVQNGFSGLLAHGAHNIRVDNNFVAGNNRERFFDGYSPAASAAGIKITTTDNGVVRNNIVQDNYSHGIWFDVSSYNPTVVNNLAQRNDRVGIYIEITEQGIVASNLAIHNGLAGIKLSGTTNVRVYNNTMIDNGIWQLSVHDDGRNNTNLVELARGITWNTAHNQIFNNILSAPATGSLGPLLYTEDLDRPKIVDAATMIVAMDSNVYVRASVGATPSLATWTRIAPQIPTGFTTLASLQAATGYEAAGIEHVNYSTSPIFTNPALSDYSLRASSGAVGTGSSLPIDISNAIGIASNAYPDRGALIYPSPAHAPATPPGAQRPVSVAWTQPEAIRLEEIATYLGTTPDEAQKAAVYLLGYVVGLLAPGQFPQTLPAAGSAVTYANIWEPAEQSVIDSVAAKFVVTDEESTRLAVAVMSYLLSIQGL